MQVVLFGPWQVHGREAQTLDGYRMLQRRIVAQNGRGTPWLHVGESPHAYVTGGKWVVDCRVCGNGPVVDVAARVALCCECGAIYEGVIVPDADVLRALEDVLSVRPVQARNSRHAGTLRHATIDELDRENQERGLPSLADIRSRRREGPVT